MRSRRNPRKGQPSRKHWIGREGGEMWVAQWRCTGARLSKQSEPAAAKERQGRTSEPAPSRNAGKTVQQKKASEDASGQGKSEKVTQKPSLHRGSKRFARRVDPQPAQHRHCADQHQPTTQQQVARGEGRKTLKWIRGGKGSHRWRKIGQTASAGRSSMPGWSAESDKVGKR